MQILVVKPLEKLKAFIETRSDFGLSGSVCGIHKSSSEVKSLGSATGRSAHKSAVAWIIFLFLNKYYLVLSLSSFLLCIL